MFITLEKADLDINVLEWVELWCIGFLYDLITLMYILLPYVCFITFKPKFKKQYLVASIINWVISFIFVYVLLIDVVAEYLFWDEFNVRFNFIAIDYLVYTREVVNNIWESYPVVKLLSIISILSLMITFFMKKHCKYNQIRWPLTTRLIILGIYLLICGLSLSVNQSVSQFSSNNYANEISKNGIYSLFSAFRNNDLNYEQLYLTEYKNVKIPSLQSVIKKHDADTNFVNKDLDNITRIVRSNNPQNLHNVVIVVMESMNASFMEAFGNIDSITPNLDKLSKEGIFFKQMYATGTRTVRGLEAITLSIPPTPGHSIVKRPNNERLYSLGFVFKERGYDTKFIYGGYGYFDNMNYFFSQNGFETIDRINFEKDEQSFSNAWGLCDEDLFNKVIKEGNKSFADNKPFLHVVMTTSNHRPFTFPANTIKLPPDKIGRRAAAVKYSDYAVGKLLNDAKKQDWFKNTIFVFVADHTAGSAGKIELSKEKYHIPMIIYAPHLIKPQIIDEHVSQIDVAPTLIGLLNFNYVNRFYGRDVFKSNNQYAFISTYQKMGYTNGNDLIVLKPGKSYAQYNSNSQLLEKHDLDETLLAEAVSYYKNAANWRVLSSYVNTVID